MSFEKNYESMNLIKKHDGCFQYLDKFGEIIYKKLKTLDNEEPLKGIEIPHFGVFTKRKEDDEFELSGIVSNYYKFMGHEILNAEIREAITDKETQILKEKTTISVNLVSMYNEIIINNPKSSNQINGNIYPEVIVKNNYNGVGSIEVHFGLFIQDNDNQEYSFGFKQKITSLKQRHFTNSKVELGNHINKYIEKFSKSIEFLIQDLFKRKLTDRNVFLTLDLIETIGKKKRKEIGEVISKSIDSEGLMGALDMFLILAKYSAKENNINSKIFLNDIIERLFNIPEKMMDLIE